MMGNLVDQLAGRVDADEEALSSDSGASCQQNPVPSTRSINEEDHSEPKFVLTEHQMKQMDPVTLHIQQTDESTMKAVQVFASKVRIILHTCDVNGYWAALERLEPPTRNDHSKIRECPIIYPWIGSVVGWFADYRAAVVRTGQGSGCRDELITALTKSFPNGKVIIGAGIAYANNRKRKFADVLISNQIENFVQYQKAGDEITNYGPRVQIGPNVQRIFENSARDWTGIKHFTCTDDNRTSVAHIGCIVSAPTLIHDEVLRDQLMKHTPNAIGGEMEGWVLLELKKTLKGQHNKDIEVIVIKGVADYGDLSNGDMWQWTAAKAAMDCIHYCLDKSGGIEFSGVVPTLCDPLPPQGVVPALRDPLPPQGVVPALRDPLPPQGVVPALRDPLPPQGVVPALRDPLPPQGVVPALRDPLPPQGVVPALRDPLPPQGVVPALRDPLPPQGVVPALRDPLPPQGVVPALRDPLPPQGVVPALPDPLPPQGVVPALPDPLPPQGVVPTLPDPLPPQDVVPTLRDPVPSRACVAPSLHDLSFLPVPDWYLFGLQLGVSGDELDMIERNYPQDDHMCKMQMFEAWLRVNTDATCEKLARALVFVGKKSIAEAMCIARGIPLSVLGDSPVATEDPLQPPPTLPPDPPECVTRYAQYLKDKYEGMSTLPDGDWPPSLGRQYTQLAMIEQERELPGAEVLATMERDFIHGNINNIVKRTKAIQLPEMFLPTEDGWQQLKILMDGAPGVGKSTLSRKICKDWASGELLQQYHLVMLLQLRWVRIRSATTIEGLIEADDLDLKQQVVKHIQRTSGEHTLLIMDGYDELRYEDRTQNSLFLDILLGNKFHMCSVLVTSRPYASDYLQQLQSVNRHVEVLGFTEEQIKHCIMENVPDKPKAVELVEILKERQDIASLCYIPLNCAIVLYVYKMEQCILPHSLTKLYESFIINAVKRHARTIGIDPKIIRRLVKLPEPFQKLLSTLSKFAYNGLVEDKMVFNIDDLEAAFPDCRCLYTDTNLLGLMTVFKGYVSSGEDLNYQFLHLTIQEFLAARWAASKLSPGELFKFFQDHLREARYRTVLLFLAGISQLSFPSAEYLFSYKLNLNPHFREVHSMKMVNYFFFLAHLIYQSQNLHQYHNLARALEGAQLSAKWYFISPFDCLVLANFLAWCDCSLKLLELDNCGLTSQSLEIIHRVNLEHHGATQIEEVDLSNNPMVSTKLSLLPKISLFEYTRKLTICGLQYPKGMSPDQVEVLCLLNLKYLTMLDISEKVVHEAGFFLSLDTFELRLGHLHIDNPVNIIRFLEEEDTIRELVMESCTVSGRCAMSLLNQMSPTLSIVGELNVLGVGWVEMDRMKTATVTLSCNAEGMSPEYSMELLRALNYNTVTVSRLDVLNLTNEFGAYLAGGLAEGMGVESLALIHSISCEGAVSIFRSLEHNTSLEELDLSGNSQLAEGDSETVGCAIERMLSVNRTLKMLKLLRSEVTDSMAKHITTGLTKDTSIEKLAMESCTVSGRCAVSLFQQMAICPTLSIVGELNVLGLGWVEMDRKTATIKCNAEGMSPEYSMELLRALNYNTVTVSRLKVLNLTNEFGAYLAGGLAEGMGVESLALIHSISCEGAVSIFRSLEHNTSLEELDLSWNSQLAESDSETVGCAIESMLNVNRTLKFFKLQITDLIAQHITKGLTKNTSLVKLEMESCSLSCRCAVSLFQQLTNCPTLKYCFIDSILGVGAVVVIDTLATIALPYSTGTVNPENCVEILRTLNHIGRVVSAHCNRKLKVNNSQGKLLNKMEESVLIAVSEMLSCNDSLTKLQLNSFDVPDPGLREIARGLLHNTSLKKLDISGSHMGTEGSLALAEMLLCNQSLTELTLRWYNIPDPGLSEIARGLLHNTSLQILKVRDTSYKTFLEAEMERLKRSENFASQNSRQLTIKTWWD